MISGEQLLEVLKTRRSVRRFTDEPVEPEVLRALIEAASWAPSATNRQDWFFTVVTKPEVKFKMADVARARWDAIVRDNQDLGPIEEVKRYAAGFGAFAGAPVVIAISCMKPAAVQDLLLGPQSRVASGSAASAAMAAENLMLAAHAHGLGSCCLTGPLAARDELATIIGLDRRREIVCIIALGEPDEEPVPPLRKPVDAIARFIE